MPEERLFMNIQYVRYGVDCLMGVAFLICFITGFFKFTLLMRLLRLTDVVMPLALMSDIHDWSGIVLGLLVAVHLVLNRKWIVSMTRKIIGRTSVRE
jgi:hypothetical protein